MTDTSPEKYDPASAIHRGRLAHELVTQLEAKGFERVTRGSEIVYRRQVARVITDEQGKKHHEPIHGVFVAVYTSIPVSGSLAVRETGKDAIRVCAIYEDGDRSLGLAKETRINRTGTIGGIIERALGRLRSCWATAIERPLCGRCDSITFRSRKQNDVCAALCWTKT